MQRLPASAETRRWAPEVGARSSSAASLRFKIASGLAVLLAAVAFREIFTYEPEIEIRSRLEGFFFEAGGTSPVLIYGVALWLVFQHRHRLRHAFRTAERGLLPGAAFLLAGATAFFWSLHTAAVDLRIVALMLTCLGGAAWLGGWPGLRAMALPALFLVFALPVPAALNNQLVYPLQMQTVAFTGWVLELVGQHPLLWGDRIYVGERIFEVIETCSGIRSMHTLTMAAVVYAYLFSSTRLQAACLVLLAPLVAFLVNTGRVLAIIYNPSSEAAAVHTTQGVAALVVGVLSLALLELVLRKLFPRSKASAVARAVPDPSRSSRRGSRTLGPDARAFGLAGIMTLLAGASYALGPVQLPERGRRDLQDLPVRLGGLRAEALPLDRHFYGSVMFDDYIYRRYGEGEQTVDVFVASHRRTGRMHSIVSAKTMLPGSGWEIRDRLRIALGRGSPEVDRLRLRFADQERLAYHWYENVESTAFEVVRAALALDQSRFRREQPARVIRVSVPLPRERLAASAAAERRLREIVDLLRAELQALDSPR